ncbi:hypothetical protein MUNTM_27940 [Mycobacterium sp. MUNTM1]
MPTLLPERHSLRVIMAGRRRLAVATHPPVPTIRAVLVGPAVRVDPAITPADPAARAALAALAITPAALAVRADPAITPADPAVRADPAITPADPADPAVRADPAITPAALAVRADPAITPVLPADSADRILTPVAPGTGTPSAATSMAHRGATDPDRGARARRRGRHGIDRFPRPVGVGTTARSTTGATRKPRSGIPVSTSGASGSSECGSRCDR